MECLLKAGRLAEKESGDKVNVIHVKKVLRTVDEVKPEILKYNISDVEKLILDISNKGGKTTFDELYDEYSKVVEDPLTKRMFREHVKHLDSINLLKIGKRKFGKSRFILKV